MHRLGENASEWLLDLRGGFIIASCAKTLENGNIGVCLNNLGLFPDIPETAKICFSAPPSSRIEIPHQKQVGETVKLLQKHVDRWSNDRVTHGKKRR